MTELTDEAVKALLAQYDLPTDCDCDDDDCVKCSHYPTFQERASKQLKAAAPDLARALLNARAERDRLRADVQAAVALAYETAAERLEINRAHLNFEALLGLLRDKALPEAVVTALSDWLDGIAAALRALADADGLAAVEALRKERDDALELAEERLRGQHRLSNQLNDTVRDLNAELAAAQQREAGLLDGLSRINDKAFMNSGEFARYVRDECAALSLARGDSLAQDEDDTE